MISCYLLYQWRLQCFYIFLKHIQLIYIYKTKMMLVVSSNKIFSEQVDIVKLIHISMKCRCFRVNRDSLKLKIKNVSYQSTFHRKIFLHNIQIDRYQILKRLNKIPNQTIHGLVSISKNIAFLCHIYSLSKQRRIRLSLN